MTELLKNERDHFLKQFEISLDSYLTNQFEQNSATSRLIFESIQYSLKSSGKRFRPLLAYLVNSLFNSEFSKIQSWLLALEFIHTYSLIHDDLPCMDNDDYRRGVLTNHKVYGDAIALLAGDSLISEAVKIIADDKNLNAETKIKLIQLLTLKIGPVGMVAGQVLDMKVDSKITASELKQIHILKTGYLIQAAATGAAIVANADQTMLNHISEFALNLGLAFQIKDDLLDHSSADQDYKSYVFILGIEKTNDSLKHHSELAEKHLAQLGLKNTTALTDLINYNLVRVS